MREQLAGGGIALPQGIKPGGYYVSTIHRPDNTDPARRLREIVAGLAALEHPVLLLVHPRLARLAEHHGIDLNRGVLATLAPRLPAIGQRRAAQPRRDHGLRRIAEGGPSSFAFRARPFDRKTEWVETVELGWNVLVDGDLSMLAQTVGRGFPAATDAAPYGDGHAAERVVEALVTR